MRMHRACCIKDEGRPLGFVNQMEKPNHLMRLTLRVSVVSDKEKAGKTCQVSHSKMNESEPLMKYRNGNDVVKTGV